MTLQEKTVRVQQTTVHYLEAGQAEMRPVLLLHGGIGAAQFNWAQCMPLLADEFRLIAPDLPGAGRSEALNRRGLDALLAWIEAFMNAVGIEQGAVVGSDLGALLARLFAAEYPQYVPAAVLVNGGGIPNIPPAFQMLARLPVVGSMLFQASARSTLNADGLKRLTAAQTTLSEEQMTEARASQPFFSGLMRGIASSGLPEKRVPSLPVLLLWGAEDALAPVSEGERIQKAIPGAKLIKIAGCGHLPQIEAAEVFAWQVTQFLNDPTRSIRPDMPGVGLL